MAKKRVSPARTVSKKAVSKIALKKISTTIKSKSSGKKTASPKVPKIPPKKKGVRSTKKASALVQRGIGSASPTDIASRSVTSMQLVAKHIELQAIDSPQISQSDPQTRDWAKRIAISGVLTALIEKRAKPTFLDEKKGWLGKMQDDYKFKQQEFPGFLDVVAAQLLPTYVFKHDLAFDTANLNNTLIGLAGAISTATT